MEVETIGLQFGHFQVAGPNASRGTYDSSPAFIAGSGTPISTKIEPSEDCLCPAGATRLRCPGFQPISANLMRGPSMGEWLLSRRDRLIVARHEVPGNRCREARPGGTAEVVVGPRDICRRTEPGLSKRQRACPEQATARRMRRMLMPL
jgi:hypothetical protein